MKLKVGFWNINMGETSFKDRKSTFKEWCKEMKLDLLLLEEVGNTLKKKNIEDLTNMKALNYVNTLNKNDKETPLQLHTLAKNGEEDKFTATVLKFPNLVQKRAALKVTYTKKPKFSLWVIHANASKKGGKEATEKVKEYLSTETGKDAIVGGDFNYSINNVKGAVHPHSWDNKDMKFTQWGKEDGATKRPDTKLHITSRDHSPLFKEILPHEVIDYVMKGKKLTVKAEENCKTEKRWIDILRYFDHCPVVYEIKD